MNSGTAIALLMFAGVAMTGLPAPTAAPWAEPAVAAEFGARPATACGPERAGAAPHASGPAAKIAGYRAKLESSPRLYPVWAELGGAYLERARRLSSWRDLQCAEEALQRSLAIQPNAVAWRWLAAVRLDQHRFAEAAALARQALEAWEADGISRAIRSDALLAMGRYDEARAVIGDRPADFYSIVGHSRLLFLTGKPLEAIAHLERALAVLGQYPASKVIEASAWAHLMIGGYYYELDRPGEARQAYARAFALDPERIDVLEHLAEWEATYGDKAAAVRMYREIIAVAPRPQERYALGALLENLGVAAEAAALKREATDAWQRRLAEGDIGVRRKLALALLDGGGDVQAGLRLARADLESRRDALAYDTLAWAHHKAGDRGQARAMLARALEHGAAFRIVREHAKAIEAP